MWKRGRDMKRFLMGNEAIALGAIHAGVHLACGIRHAVTTEIWRRWRGKTTAGFSVSGR
jgi:TPP-dependent indolepyruvate ferredoxin oxidoreductase alpha subunit